MYNPDEKLCDCGGSGWTPGIPDDEPCPFHSGELWHFTAAGEVCDENGLPITREELLALYHEAYEALRELHATIRYRDAGGDGYYQVVGNIGTADANARGALNRIQPFEED